MIELWTHRPTSTNICFNSRCDFEQCWIRIDWIKIECGPSSSVGQNELSEFDQIAYDQTAKREMAVSIRSDDWNVNIMNKNQTSRSIDAVQHNCDKTARTLFPTLLILS